MDDEKRTWDGKAYRLIETLEKMKNFFLEIEAVCRKYSIAISHEDNHGAFIIVEFDPYYIEWLKNAIKEY